MPPEFVLLSEILAAENATRDCTIAQLSRRLQQGPSASGQVLCHRPDELYVLLPVPLAERLLKALSTVRAAQATA